HWSPHRRGAVRQVQELPDGVLLGGGPGVSCPALRIRSQTPGRAGRRDVGKEGADSSVGSFRSRSQALRQSLGARYQRVFRKPRTTLIDSALAGNRQCASQIQKSKG